MRQAPLRMEPTRAAAAAARAPRQRRWRSVVATATAAVAGALAAVVGLPHSAAAVEASSALAKLLPFQRQCFPTAEACVLLLNQYGSFGCAQCGADLISAPVAELNELSALNAFLQVEEAGPRAVLLPSNLLFDPAALEMLARNPKNVAAVLIAWQPSGAGPPRRYSPESAEPNKNASLAGSGVEGGWNRLGLDLVSRYYPFNVFLLPPSVVDIIRERTQRFRGGPASTATADGGGSLGPGDGTTVSGTQEDQFPRFVVQSAGKMWACDQTVSECLNDNTCLPVGGQSVWAAATRLRTTVAAEYVAVAAPMDSTALFHSRAVGAASEVSALVTMLAVAEAFGAYAASQSNRTLVRVPVFVGFNAEAYGYAGSRRFLNDIINFQCMDEEDAAATATGGCKQPFMPSLKFQVFRRSAEGAEDGSSGTRFSHVIDIGPVGSATDARDTPTPGPINTTADAMSTPRPVTNEELAGPFPFYAHAASNTSTGLQSLLLSAFQRVDPPSGAPPAGESIDLIAKSSLTWPQYPPTSGQSFIAEAATSVGLPEVVTLADFDVEFRDHFYHSELSTLPSDPAPLVEAIALAARGVVRTVIALAYFDVDTTDPASLETLAANDEFVQAAGEAADSISTESIGELLTCLTGNWTTCKLASDLLGEDTRDSLARFVSPSNYAGTYVPPTRAASLTPSSAAKVRLLRAFLATATAFAGRNGDAIECSNEAGCKDKLNADAEALHCVQDRCLAADVYTHNAYGIGLQPILPAQSSFALRNTTVGDSAWTESHWDGTLGVCGSTEDAFVLSIGILFAGLGVLGGAIGLSAVVAWALSEGKGTSVVRGVVRGAGGGAV